LLNRIRDICSDGKPVNVRLLFLAILFSIGLLCVACGPSADKTSGTPVVSEKKKPVEKNKTIRVKHLSGEVLSVNSKAKTITVRVREEDIELQFDDLTVVKIDLDRVQPHEIPPGTRATVKYVESKGQFVARGVFISTETAEKKESPPQSSFRSSA
jgi:hypothetical protein